MDLDWKHMEREERPPDFRPTLSLLRRARAASEALAAATSHFGTTPDQWLTLELLVNSGESGLSMTQLRMSTGLAGATLTRTVDKLITDALAYREVDPADRRRIVVYASAGGLDLYARSKDAVDAIEQSLAGSEFALFEPPARAEQREW